MTIPVPTGDKIVDDINRFLSEQSHYISPDNLWFRRKLAEVEKLKNSSLDQALNAASSLYQLLGDLNEAIRLADGAINASGGNPVFLANKAAVYSNLGCFSLAQDPFRRGVAPERGWFTPRWHLGITVGAFQTLREWLPIAEKMNLEGFDRVDRDLIITVSDWLKSLAITEEKLASLFDVVGEVMREKKVFFEGVGPDISIWTDDPLERHISFNFKFAIPNEEAMDMDEEIGHRLFERFGDLPAELMIHAESVLLVNGDHSTRPALAG